MSIQLVIAIGDAGILATLIHKAGTQVGFGEHLTSDEPRTLPYAQKWKQFFHTVTDKTSAGL